MPRVGDPDGNNPATANVWDVDRWVKARVALPNPRGGRPLLLVWDNKAAGTCQECGETVRRGETVYRAPTRPWRSRKDFMVHVRCWDLT
jgi:hypothetical protein